MLDLLPRCVLNVGFRGGPLLNRPQGLTMARWFEPRPDQVSGWEAWVAERPESIRAVAARILPWELYRLTSTGQVVTLASISEPGEDGRQTVRVNVLVDPRFAAPVPVFGVFGLDPDDLEPYEPTTRDELISLAARAVED